MEPYIHISPWVIVPIVFLTVVICSVINRISRKIITRSKLRDIRDRVQQLRSEAIDAGNTNLDAFEFVLSAWTHVYDKILQESFLVHFLRFLKILLLSSEEISEAKEHRESVFAASAYSTELEGLYQSIGDEVLFFYKRTSISYTATHIVLKLIVLFLRMILFIIRALDRTRKVVRKVEQIASDFNYAESRGSSFDVFLAEDDFPHRAAA